VTGAVLYIFDKKPRLHPVYNETRLLGIELLAYVRAHEMVAKFLLESNNKIASPSRDLLLGCH
jgi:hypothetical protein